MDENLAAIVKSYLESLGFKILRGKGECIVADKLVYGYDRDTWIVWTVPTGQPVASYEPTLRASISELRPAYPGARAYVIGRSLGGFSRDFMNELKDHSIKFLVPIWFFDTPFKVEEAPRAASVISDIRSLAASEKRVPQPYSSWQEGPPGSVPSGKDLLETLQKNLVTEERAVIRIVVGRAGIGKSVLFRALFSRLYEDFLQVKNRQGARRRPIPILPEHLRGIYALRTELLVDNFLRTDVAAHVTRDTFEWLLVNGFATWLLDGLDELYAGDRGFFDYLLDLITRKGSKAQITLWCRDSLLTTSDALEEFRNFCSGSGCLEIYQLTEWERSSKRLFSWFGIEGRAPRTDEKDTPAVASFLGSLDRSPSLQKLSGLPFYCKVLLDQFKEGHVREFTDDLALLDHVIAEMINREVQKGLLDLRFFEPDGLGDWIEDIAIDSLERSYAEIRRDDVIEYGRLVLKEGVDRDTQNHILTSLLQFPFFHAGNNTGMVSFSHELIAQALAAKGYLRRLARQTADISFRLAQRIDPEDPALLRFMARKLGEIEEGAIIEELQRGTVQDKAFVILLSLLMLARPEYDLLKRIRPSLETKNLTGVRFERRDLREFSFRMVNLSHAVFRDCDLRGTRFEGALLDRTAFNGQNQLEGAEFGDLSRIQSINIGRRLLVDLRDIRDWVVEVTGITQPLLDPCPSALQLVYLFGKFITPLGMPRRDDLGQQALLGGKRYPGAAPMEECLDEAVGHGYITGPDFRERFRRAEGDLYAEMVRFVRDSSVSQGLGRLLSKLCRRRGCTHQIRAS